MYIQSNFEQLQNNRLKNLMNDNSIHYKVVETKTKLEKQQRQNIDTKQAIVNE